MWWPQDYDEPKHHPWVENPAYDAPPPPLIPQSSPKPNVRIPPKSVPASPTTYRKKYKVKVEENVDKETAKMVENLKERLKTFDQDLDRVKQAALKIHQDLSSCVLPPPPPNQEESKVTRGIHAAQQNMHSKDFWHSLKSLVFYPFYFWQNMKKILLIF